MQCWEDHDEALVCEEDEDEDEEDAGVCKKHVYVDQDNALVCEENESLVCEEDVYEDEDDARVDVQHTLVKHAASSVRDANILPLNIWTATSCLSIFGLPS